MSESNEEIKSYEDQDLDIMNTMEAPRHVWLECKKTIQE